jgi:hypothetical protein
MVSKKRQHDFLLRAKAKSYFPDTFRYEEQGWNYDTMWQKICHQVNLTLLVLPQLVPENDSCFEMYGFDVLLDEDLTPWLIEVNCSPALGMECDVDYVVKKPLIADLVSVLQFDDPDQPKPTSDSNSASNSTAQPSIAGCVASTDSASVVPPSVDGNDGVHAAVIPAVAGVDAAVISAVAGSGSNAAPANLPKDAGCSVANDDDATALPACGAVAAAVAVAADGPASADADLSQVDSVDLSTTHETKVEVEAPAQSVSVKNQDVVKSERAPKSKQADIAPAKVGSRLKSQIEAKTGVTVRGAGSRRTSREPAVGTGPTKTSKSLGSARGTRNDQGSGRGGSGTRRFVYGAGVQLSSVFTDFILQGARVRCCLWTCLFWRPPNCRSTPRAATSQTPKQIAGGALRGYAKVNRSVRPDFPIQ